MSAALLPRLPMGSPMKGHVKMLRDFRDSYLLSYSTLNYGLTITATVLVFVFVFPIFFALYCRRKMKGHGLTFDQ